MPKPRTSALDLCFCAGSEGSDGDAVDDLVGKVGAAEIEASEEGDIELVDSTADDGATVITAGTVEAAKVSDTKERRTICPMVAFASNPLPQHDSPNVQQTDSE
jgi:hypothetical protein